MAYEDLKQRYNKYRNRVSDTKLVQLLIIIKIKLIINNYGMRTGSDLFHSDHRTAKFIKH